MAPLNPARVPLGLAVIIGLSVSGCATSATPTSAVTHPGPTSVSPKPDTKIADCTVWQGIEQQAVNAADSNQQAVEMAVSNALTQISDATLTGYLNSIYGDLQDSGALPRDPIGDDIAGVYPQLAQDINNANNYCGTANVSPSPEPTAPEPGWYEIDNGNGKRAQPRDTWKLGGTVSAKWLADGNNVECPDGKPYYDSQGGTDSAGLCGSTAIPDTLTFTATGSGINYGNVGERHTGYSGITQTVEIAHYDVTGDSWFSVDVTNGSCSIGYHGTVLIRHVGSYAACQVSLDNRDSNGNLEVES